MLSDDDSIASLSLSDRSLDAELLQQIHHQTTPKNDACASDIDVNMVDVDTNDSEVDWDTIGWDNDWDDIIVVVRAFKKVATTSSFNLSFVEEELGGLKSIKHSEIVNIIGRIDKQEDMKKVTYLVRNRAETTLEVCTKALLSVLQCWSFTDL